MNRISSLYALSVMFQLNESTIKRWADAGKLRCYKTPGGHRKFSYSHLTKKDINALLYEHGQSFVELYLECAFQADTESLVRILHNRLSAGLSLEEIYDSVIGTTARTIFQQREENTISEVEKHIASTSILREFITVSNDCDSKGGKRTGGSP